MISCCFLLFHISLLLLCLGQENRGINDKELKELDISHDFVVWNEGKIEEKWKVNGADKVLFANKYKDMCFSLEDTGHVYYI